MDIRYRYEGTEFLIREYHFEKERPYSEVIGIRSHGDEVCVPSTVNGYKVYRLKFPLISRMADSDKKDYCYSGVRKLILPSDLVIYNIYNSTFPDLEEMEFLGGVNDYVFSEGMLYDRGGKRLLLTFKRGFKSDEIRVPAKVEEIGPDAFRGSSVRRISFANPDIAVSGNPFESSAWFKEHKEAGDTIFTGNMVYRHFSSDELVLDSSIKRISPDCFEFGCPEEVTTHFIPAEEIIGALDKGGCKKITVTSDCDIPWDRLRKWKGLREVRLPAHSTYTDFDGVVFDKKRNELVFYPPDRTPTHYTIPEGTVSIGCKAFMDQERLTRVTFCDSITSIMQGAFCNCTNLKSVLMRNCRVTELPDAGIFNDHGVFEGCRHLKEIDLPDTLRRIGSRAFYKAGLQEQMIIKEGVKSIGSYAFYRTSLSKVSLPRTLEYISPGAFVNRDSSDTLSISVYENTAYGLFGALENVAYGREPKYDARMWQEADITFLDLDGNVSDTMHIPKSMNAGYEGLLERAITHCGLDRGIYLRCLAGFKDADEKIAIALKTVEENKDVDGICDALLRQMAVQITDAYISDLSEEKLIGFLKRGYLTPEDMRLALGKCNEKGLSQASAYILHYLGGSLTETMSRLSL